METGAPMNRRFSKCVYYVQAHVTVGTVCLMSGTDVTSYPELRILICQDTVNATEYYMNYIRLGVNYRSALTSGQLQDICSRFVYLGASRPSRSSPRKLSCSFHARWTIGHHFPARIYPGTSSRIQLPFSLVRRQRACHVLVKLHVSQGMSLARHGTYSCSSSL